jgi:hypothetical protein
MKISFVRISFEKLVSSTFFMFIHVPMIHEFFYRAKAMEKDET